jgi:succinate dehydrogenase / fumarate reductase iron-sulfur subunit
MNPKSGPTKTYRFEVLRYDGAADAPRFQAYDLVPDRKLSVLESLLKIQDEQDPSLAFRYACRGAICGSCAMSINGKLNLACRVQLHTLPTERVVLEPLPGLEIVKDLVVDMDPFWRKYERVRPWLHAEVSAGRENLMSERERERIDQYIHCILCGLCYSSCPAVRSNADFAGPAALAKLQRFLADSRDGGDGDALRTENSEAGVWGCRNVMECVRACPKDVRPSDGIRGARRKLIVEKVKHVLRRKTRED